MTDSANCTISDRERPRIEAYRRQLLVCVGPYCAADGMTPAALHDLGRRLLAAGLLCEGHVKATRVHCLGACTCGPIMCVQPDGVWYCEMKSANVARVIDQHLIGGRVVDDLVFHRGPGTT